MPTVEPVKVLTIDEVPLNVAELSAAVQQLVTIFDEWNQAEADARNNLMMVSAAKDTLSRQIIQTVRQDKQAAEEAAKAAVAAAAPAVDEVAAPVADISEAVAETVAVTGDTEELPAE